ncbi:MAG: ABC transporter permease [Pyrinomonadaceae bacterium]
MYIANLTQDVRYGLRTMLKNPLFTLIAVLAIAIGIGANVLVFSLVERILLSSLPYKEPDRLVKMLQAYPEGGLTSWGLSPALFSRYHDQNRTLDALAAYSNAGTILTGTDKPEFLQSGRVTADFFKVFGVDPVVGRGFSPGEDVQGKNSVCVLSYGLWQRRFGGDPNIVGKKLLLGDVPTEVVGVMPASFKFPAPETELWIPMALNPQAMHPFMLSGVARLKPGVGIEAAEADTSSVFKSAAAENPEMAGRKTPLPPGAGLKTVMTPLKEALVGKLEKPLLMLQIAVAFVLLIACANVANLLLSRATRRKQEIALRLALGATRGRLIRQLLTESLLLSLIGAATGITIAWWCLDALGRVYAQGIPRIEEAGISRTVLAVTLLMTLLTGVLFGLVPALRAYRMGLRGGMNEGGKGSVGAANRRLNSTLVAAQLALSLVLLVGAGLMVKSFQRLLTVDPGFGTDRVLTMVVPISGKKYEGNAEAASFYKRLTEEVRALPGVTAAAVSSSIPLNGKGAYDSHIAEGHEPPGEEAPQADIKVVSPGYFQAMGMSLRQGRDFSETDNENSPLVAVIDQKMAQMYWPNGDAIGKRVRTSDPDWYTIIGVAPTVKGASLTEESAPHLYLSFGQLYFAYGMSRDQRRMYLTVNTDRPQAIVSSIRDRVRALDPDVPVYSVSTMAEVIQNRIGSQRLISLLLSVFGGIALLLAAIGTYGVMSIFVNSRASEFAIRLALGAQPRHVLFSVMRQGLVIGALGAVVGLFGSWALTRAISSQLYEVTSVDPAVFSITPAVLLGVVLLACYVPARRAARTDPAVTLRNP